MIKDIEFECSNVDISPYSSMLYVSADCVDVEDIVLNSLNDLEPTVIIDNSDISQLLDAIGIEKCKDYFDLIEMDS